MEVQMAAQAPRSMGRSTPSHHSGGGKPVPGYLRPSTGSCHHVCKYGGTQTFEEKETHRTQPRPRKQPPAPESQNRVLVKVRSVFRRRVGDSTRATTEKRPKAAAGKAKGGDSMEWKDIVAYDAVPLPPHGSPPQLVAQQVTGSGDAKEKDVMKKVNKSYGTAKIDEQVDGIKGRNEPLGTGNANTDVLKSVKPPKGKNPTTLLVESMAIDQEILHGYQVMSPSLVQSRANLLRDLEKEMVHDAANEKEGRRTSNSLDPQEYAAAAAESSRPVPAHRRVKSMSISSRPVRYPLARQASKNSGTFKLRSRSTRAPVLLPPEEEKPARLRSSRGEDLSAGGGTGRGIQFRIRSLRRRGVGGSGGTGTATGFVVPAVALRHQKTLEKKRSQRLYNNMIEETASKLVKTRKSRVKALVGAFESIISKIAK